MQQHHDPDRLANDRGDEQIFARQVHALVRPGDLLLAISTSGTSANVVAAARAGRERGGAVIGLTGRRGGELVEACDLTLCVPSDDTARIQEAHLFILHTLAELLEG